MGADVYLVSVHEKSKAEHEPAFKAACADRDALPRGSAAARKAQKKVDVAFNRLMSAEGYFRDPYNETTFLDKLGLSWWVDIVPRLTKKDGKLPLKQAKWFIEQLETRQLDEAKMLKVTAPKNTLEDTRKYYEKDRADLIKLLKKSIELREPLVCSL